MTETGSGIARSGLSARIGDFRERIASVIAGNAVTNFTRGEVIGIVGPENCGLDASNIGEEAGVYFRVKCFISGIIVNVRCGHAYDELRTVYGTDGNLVGRECIITHVGDTKEDLAKGEAKFAPYPLIRYPDEERVSNIAPTGAMFGTTVDSASADTMLAGFDNSDPDYPGEL